MLRSPEDYCTYGTIDIYSTLFSLDGLSIGAGNRTEVPGSAEVGVGGRVVGVPFTDNSGLAESSDLLD